MEKLEKDDVRMFDEEKEDCYEKALEGLDYLYALTNPTPEDPELELRRGKRMVDIAKKLGIKLMIWSSLPNVKKLTEGRLLVPQFTMKAMVEEYLKERKLDYIALMPGLFLSNLETNPMFKPTRLEPGKDEWCLRLPLRERTKIPFLDPSRDLGPAVLHLLNNMADFKGRQVPLYGEELAMPELLRKISPKVKYMLLEDKKLRELPLERREVPLDNNALDMFRYFDDYGYYGKASGLVNLRKQMKLAVEPAEEYFKGRTLLK